MSPENQYILNIYVKEIKHWVKDLEAFRKELDNATDKDWNAIYSVIDIIEKMDEVLPFIESYAK